MQTFWGQEENQNTDHLLCNVTVALDCFGRDEPIIIM